MGGKKGEKRIIFPEKSPRMPNHFSKSGAKILQRWRKQATLFANKDLTKKSAVFF
ncbi:MAG: hypothetical protein KDC61_03800 [Saprospiraceae bacterium]|nr:hypothetical protein [Saprospiraceae bacterium]